MHFNNMMLSGFIGGKKRNIPCVERGVLMYIVFFYSQGEKKYYYTSLTSHWLKLNQILTIVKKNSSIRAIFLSGPVFFALKDSGIATSPRQVPQIFSSRLEIFK